MISFKINIFVLSNTTTLLSVPYLVLLWLALKLVSLHYQIQQEITKINHQSVVISFKISIFALSNTTNDLKNVLGHPLWLALKLVSLHYQIQQITPTIDNLIVVISFKISIFALSNTTYHQVVCQWRKLWFAWKFVPLWYQQQLKRSWIVLQHSCDLLENSYLCGISNNSGEANGIWPVVVICLKIRTFVVSATTIHAVLCITSELWFAWKFVPLWYQQQRSLF